MKRFLGFMVILAFLVTLPSASCRDYNDKAIPMRSGVFRNSRALLQPTAFDSTLIHSFFTKNPALNKYQSEVRILYRKYQYQYIWHHQQKINALGLLLYDKLSDLPAEGIDETVPYKDQLDYVLQHPDFLLDNSVDTELLFSSLYFFYADKVYYGLDVNKRIQMGWYLPRKRMSAVNYLDSLLKNPVLLHKDENVVFGQYYRLRNLLKKYRHMDQKTEGTNIVMDPKVQSLQLGDSSNTIRQIRKHLYLMEDLVRDSKSQVYDQELAAGILKYKKRNAFALNTVVLPKHVASMNIPLKQRIKTILVNMERCRWMGGTIGQTNEFIVINIPAYQLSYFIDGKKQLVSAVVVGKAMNKTVVFTADMKYIVFSPYWNVPQSILHKEILPAVAKNKNYLAQHQMEWHNQGVRQRPGPKNALGLIKFLFPNNNSIYLHDTPSKHLFDQEQRAFSHGCIRVAKPVELARIILRNDPNWTAEKIDLAMRRGVETWYPIKNKISVYIGYFTAWVDNEGLAHFYDDVYKRDAVLYAVLLDKQIKKGP